MSQYQASNVMINVPITDPNDVSNKILAYALVAKKSKKNIEVLYNKLYHLIHYKKGIPYCTATYA